MSIIINIHAVKILDSRGNPISEPNAKAYKENPHVLKLFGYDENGKLKSPGQLKMRKTMTKLR